MELNRRSRHERCQRRATRRFPGGEPARVYAPSPTAHAPSPTARTTALTRPPATHDLAGQTSRSEAQRPHDGTRRTERHRGPAQRRAADEMGGGEHNNVLEHPCPCKGGPARRARQREDKAKVSRPALNATRHDGCWSRLFRALLARTTATVVDQRGSPLSRRPVPNSRSIEDATSASRNSTRCW